MVPPSFDATVNTPCSIHVNSAEIILFENHIVLYRTSVDVTIYVIGYLDENELILSSLLSTLFQVFSNLLGG